MDADTLVLKNIDDLFDREELSAAPDVGWPDCFNSGVFVFRPSELTYSKLLQFAVTTGSFDGGDQGLLNQYFSDWASKDISKHLPFIYNVVGHSFYSYLPAFFQYGQATKVAHFIGAVKPWHMGYNKATNCVESGDTRHIADFVYIWWRIFMEDVHHKLLGDLAAAATEEPPAANLDTFTKDKLEDHQHQLNWEHGQIDYLGVDSFDNIMKQINAVITTPPLPAPRRSASDGNVPTLTSPTSPATPTKGKRRPASVIDTSDGGGEPVFEPELAPTRVRPVEGAIGSIGVEHLLGADEPEAGTERKELVVRLPAARRQELISPAQLVAQEPGLDRLLARVSAGKPTVPRRARVVPAPVERVERVIRAAGKRQEIISPAELVSLTAPLVINGSRTSSGAAINGTVTKPTTVSSSTRQSRVEQVASKPPNLAPVQQFALMGSAARWYQPQRHPVPASTPPLLALPWQLNCLLQRLSR